MNWRRDDQSFSKTLYRDFFAPESVLAPDGRRVMWAWLVTLNEEITYKTIQSLPRELSIGKDGTLRMSPLRELQSQRLNERVLTNVAIEMEPTKHSVDSIVKIADMEGDSLEISVLIKRDEAIHKRFGFFLFSDDPEEGFPIIINPPSKAIRVGTVEAPFLVSDIPEGEDLEIRIFVDRYLIEVFVGDRQAVVGSHMDYKENKGLFGYTYGSSTELDQIKIWKLKPTNRGFLKAQKNKIWECDLEK